MPAPKGHEPYPGSESGGRPPRHSQEDIERFADEFSLWLREPSHVWFKDFCLDRDINPDCISEWAQLNEKFRGVYQQAKHRQESRLVNGGLTSAYNSAIVKLVLSNAHGWSDRQETKLSGDANNPLAFLMTTIDGSTKDLIHEDEDNAD